MTRAEVKQTWEVFFDFLRNTHKPKPILWDDFREYLEESNHAGWDGFSSRDLTGIRKLLDDFRIYTTTKHEGL